MQLDERGAMLRDLEKRLHRPEIRASADEVACLLADEFFEFGASGSVWTRVIDGLPREQMQPAYELGASDFLVNWLADDVALITYRCIRRIPSETKELHFLRSSIWKRIYGQRRMVFHQGTNPVRQPVKSSTQPLRFARMAASLHP
jgi:glyoxylase I family protein